MSQDDGKTNQVTRRTFIKAGLMTGAALALPDIGLGQSSAGGEFPHFGNITLNVIGDKGQNTAAFAKYADDFAKAGIKVNVTGTTFTGLYSKEKTEFVAGGGAYDLVVFFPAYLGDFAANGYLEPLTRYVAKKPSSVWDPDLEDVFTPYRELYCKWNDIVYTLPYDGDVLLMYYRKDLFEHPAEKAAYLSRYGKELTPPETWDDWLKAAEFFTRTAGERLAGQALTKPFYGAATYGARGFSYAWFLARFGGAVGRYFSADMKPQINQPAAVAGLQNMVDTVHYSPPNVLSFGYVELMNAYLNGDVAMVIQWADVGKKAEDPGLSKIVGKAGFSLVPGTVVGGKVMRRAPMPVGRVLAVPKDAKHKEAAYWVAKYLSLNAGTETVSANWSGEDPYRYSQLSNLKPYVKPTMFPSEAVAQKWATADLDNLKSGFPELNIPGAAQYTDALDLNVNKALAGELTAQKALDNAAAQWDKITNQLGRDAQKKYWESQLAVMKRVGLL